MKQAILKSYANKLCQIVLNDILSWKSIPELSKLYRKLISITDLNMFLDHWAEAIIARHLINKGCEIKVEVPTPKGKCVDFCVNYSSKTFCLHVKRLNADIGFKNHYNKVRRLDSLLNIQKPYSVDLEFLPDLSLPELTCFIRKAKSVILAGNPGELTNIVDSTGETIGSCHIVKKHHSPFITIRGKPAFSTWLNSSCRFISLLKKAYDQFMPNGNNIILMSSDYSSDICELREALNSNNGFWQCGRHRQSQIILWFSFSPKTEYVEFSIIRRNNVSIPLQLSQIFC